VQHTHDEFVVADAVPVPPLDREQVSTRVAVDHAAARSLDPLDALPAFVLSRMWVQEGSRLVARESAVRAVAAEQGWTFTPLDGELSGRLCDADVTADTPRVARNVGRVTGSGEIVLDLTGVLLHLDGARDADHLHLRVACAALVPFHGRDGHRIVVLPADASGTTWERFGPGVATESPEFDEMYRVHAQDAGWATIVLNPALMADMITNPRTTLVVSGGYLAVIEPGFVVPQSLPALLSRAERLAFSAQAAAWHAPT